MSDFSLSWIDFSVIIIYLAGIIWYGIAKGKQSSSEDYFLAGRDMTWPIVGIALFFSKHLKLYLNRSGW